MATISHSAVSVIDKVRRDRAAAGCNVGLSDGSGTWRNRKIRAKVDRFCTHGANSNTDLGTIGHSNQHCPLASMTI